MSVDTLSISRELREADLPGAQADAIAAVIGRALTDSLETKTELTAFIGEMRSSFGALDHRLDAIEQRLVGKIEASRSSLLIWFIGVVVALGGLGVAIAKL